MAKETVILRSRAAAVGRMRSSAATSRTAVLLRPHLGAHHVARRDAGAAGLRAPARAFGAADAGRHGAGGEAEIGLLQPLDLVAQPRGFLEFEIGRGGAHALFEIGDDGFEVLALVMRRVAFAEPDRDVVAARRRC